MRRLWMAFFFVISQIMPVPLFAQSPIINGKIKEISALPNGMYLLRVEEETQAAEYFIHPSTKIHVFIPAEDLKIGNEIILSKAEEEGAEGPPPQAKAPAKPPKIPEIPEIPEIPKIPEVPKPPQAPKAPSIPETPEPPPAPEGAEQPPAPPSEGAGEPPPAAPPGPPPAEEPAQASPPAPPEEEKPEEAMPLPDSEALGKLLGEKTLGKTVIDLNKTPEEVAMELEDVQGNTESRVLKPDEKVSKILTVKDLRSDMLVRLNLAEDSEEPLVQTVLVL